MAKIDPRLKYFAASVAADLRVLTAVAPVRRAAAAAPEMVNVMVEVEAGNDGPPQGLLDAGFVLRTRAGNVLTGDLPRTAIPDLERIPGLKRAEASRPLRPELDHALPEARVVALHTGPPPRRGAGVIVGIIDDGIAFRHPSFRNGDGSSRILAIWDQRLEARGGEAPPADFGYGVEYTRATIDSALVGPHPRLRVRHVEQAPFHGTHVAGIAAGNGRPSGRSTGTQRFVGVAPDADLIVVANTRGLEKDPGTFADSADTLDAVRYILQMAERLGKAVVINLSQGDNIGPHDGTSLLEVGIASLIDGPGRALIKSAGNEGDSKRHAQGILPASGSNDVQIEVPDGEQEVTVDIWYPRAHRLSLRISPPGGAATTAPFNPPVNRMVTLSNGNKAFVDADLKDPGNYDNRTFVVLHPGTKTAVRKGAWTFHLKGTGAWHAWIQGGQSSAVFTSRFASAATTISIPGTSPSVITVGAYISKDPFSLGRVGRLSDISSHGPTRDGRRAPTLSAPGEEIHAPQPPSHFVGFKGTSMSAAMITGAVALMFEDGKELTASDVRQRLEQTARNDANTGAVPNNDWGFGKLDVEAACGGG
jgi:subtilisin family serine protease